MNALVSVIIPVYNAAKTIEETIKSVLNQSYTNLEIIIIDDFSSDNSFEIVKELSKCDKRIVLCKNSKNFGVARTRNIGINMANGEFVAFLDSDDTWKKSKIEKQLEYIREKNIDICYSSYEMISDNKIKKALRIVPEKINYHYLLKENIICCSTVVVKSELLKKYPFEVEFFHEDFVLWLKLLKNGYKAMGMKESLVVYRKGGRSSDKIKASRNRWIVYRKSQKLNITSSIYYYVVYVINGIKKYYF